MIAFGLVTSIGVAADRVDIIVDNSADMWRPIANGLPNHVAVREALLDFAAASVFGDQDLEIGLWVIGSEAGAPDIESCGEGGVIRVTAALDPEALQSILPELRPGGLRALSRALSAAAEVPAPPHRIVLMTSGGDQCQQDVVRAAGALLNSEPPIELRIIGLGLDREMADAAALLAPTRNVADPSKLSSALSWALEAKNDANPRTADFTFSLGQGGVQLEGFNAELINSGTGEKTITTVKDGDIRSRLVPGRYRASIPFETGLPVELSGLVTTSTGIEIEIVLSPPVTLEIANPLPARGEPIFVQFWGAPDGINWVTLALEGSPLGYFLARAEARGQDNEIELLPPAVGGELEARFLHEPSFGVFQLLGTLPLEPFQRTAVFKAPETVENGSRFELDWKGPNLPKDRISIGRRIGETMDVSVCIYAASGGPQTLTAPFSPGDYVIRYQSATGDTLTSARLDVFEVLASLDAPSQAAPGREVEVSWTGPDDPTDFISIAEPASPADEYLTWSPTATGSPARLRAPSRPGEFEYRYVRGGNAEILSRIPLKTVAAPVSMLVPEIVVAGTRFAVILEGTPAANDLVVIAEIGSDDRSRIDWSYATAEGSLSLAAPFHPGKFEVRYISGDDLEITDRVFVTVR